MPFSIFIYYHSVRNIIDCMICEDVIVFRFVLGKTLKTPEMLLAADKIRFNISIRQTPDDLIMNPAFSVRAAGETNTSSSSPLKKRAPKPFEALPRGRNCIIFLSFHFIWFHMFHAAIYSSLWVCVTSIFILKPLGPGADSGWPLFKCLLHSEQNSLQQSWWLCSIYLISKVFLFALAAKVSYSAMLITGAE